jgi:hypothetical protein
LIKSAIKTLKFQANNINHLILLAQRDFIKQLYGTAHEFHLQSFCKFS